MDYSDYALTTTTVTRSGDLAAAGSLAGTVFVTMMIFMIIGGLIAYAITSFLTSRIFKKAGVKQSIAWIPIYSTWKMLELGGQKGYWAPLLLVPFVNIASLIFYYIALYHIGKKFGKEDWFVALAIFIAPVWFIILGFDKSVWNGGTAAASTTGGVPAYVPPVQTTQDNVDSEPVATEATAPTESTPDSSNEQ